MSNAQTLATHGLVTLDNLRSQTSSGTPISTGIILEGFFAAPSKDNLISKAYYDRDIGLLDLYALPDRSGIRIRVTPTFPEQYEGTYCIVRGRYEYKSQPSQSGAHVIYEQVAEIPTAVEIIDTEVEPGVWYYYTLIAASTFDSGPIHFAYNPNTGAGPSFRYKDFNQSEVIYASLTDKYRVDDTDSFTKDYTSIFGNMYDTLLTDVETYVGGSKDLQNVEESQLEYLADYVGWPITREAGALVAREELSNSRTLYSQKGRNNAIEFDIQLITGWEVDFEEGKLRMLQADTFGHSNFDPSDDYLLANIGLPVRIRRLDYLTVSSGTPSISFELPGIRVRNVTIAICDGDVCENWTEVSDFSVAGPTDKVYVLTEDVNFITALTFGDGVNGKVPIAGREIHGGYQFGGDSGHYTQSGTDSWENAVGYRVILDDTPGSRPLTSPLINKVSRIIENLAPSYAVYSLIVSGEDSESLTSFVDSYSDEVLEVSPFQLNNPLSLLNDPATVLL